jgi:ATP-dependent protease ClpP protease subunit
MIHSREREEDEEVQEKEKPYSFYKQKMATNQFHYYISGPIEEPSRYTEMIHQIRTAGQNDVVHVHLNTPGGLVSTGVQIISAMRASNGHIVTHLEGEACSMGALLFLTADEMVVYDDSLLMFHNYSGWAHGKGHEITASVDATNKWYSKLARTVCTPFLSEAELDKIFDGADLWMLSNEVEDRLKKMAKKLAAEVKDQDKKVAVARKKKTTKKKAKVSKKS